LHGSREDEPGLATLAYSWDSPCLNFPGGFRLNASVGGVYAEATILARLGFW
jgi:hypothetical protein